MLPTSCSGRILASQAPRARWHGGRAIYGIIETTLRLLRQDDVTHVAAATDTVIESFRNDLYEGYKTGDGIEPALWAQFPLAEEALRVLGVVVWPLREFEADDALATAALRWVDDVDKVVILSPDKDLMQCVVGHRIVTFNRREQIEYDEAGVIDKFGISPVSIPDYLALVGDTADGVPGITGWGAKSTSTVLARYVRLERIPHLGRRMGCEGARRCPPVAEPGGLPGGGGAVPNADHAAQRRTTRRIARGPGVAGCRTGRIRSPL